ncbi:MAG: hypothetical protein KY392_00830 [Chloroflexi bacterium]|nr:hypothetical protein [Chloroflexota bacterium]
MTERIVYCLTRDHELARSLDERLVGAIAFFYNDAARLHQAVTLRQPELVLVDTAAIRVEYGDAGLGPVVDFLRHRCPDARLTVRPGDEAVAHLVRAEAGTDVELVPSDVAGCVDAMAAACGCP